MLALIAFVSVLDSTYSPLPRSILFHESPATIADMKALSGKWANRLGKTSMTLIPVRPGWMRFIIYRDNFNYWPGHPRAYNVAITTHDKQLFLSIRLRDMVAKIGRFEYDYLGEECYFPAAIAGLERDKINILLLNADSMRSANPWLPAPLPETADGSFKCGDMVLLAHAAEKRHVVVIVDPRVPADEGPFHRIPMPRPRR